MNTAEDLRKAFTARYPDVENDDFCLENSGFSHEHPLTAIAVVLLSAVVIGTTDITKLVEFTKYSARFVRAIALNMENSRLRKDGKYHSTTWSSRNVLPTNKNEDSYFWDDIMVAEGSQWTPDAETHTSVDTGKIFLEEKRVN